MPHGLLYDELHHAISMYTLLIFLSDFERTLHLVNQGLHHSEAKTDVFRSLINSCAGLKTQQLNVVGN